MVEPLGRPSTGQSSRRRRRQHRPDGLAECPRSAPCRRASSRCLPHPRAPSRWEIVLPHPKWSGCPCVSRTVVLSGAHAIACQLDENRRSRRVEPGVDQHYALGRPDDPGISATRLDAHHVRSGHDAWPSVSSGRGDDARRYCGAKPLACSVRPRRSVPTCTTCADDPGRL